MNTTISNNGLPKLPQPPSGQGNSATQGPSGTTSSDAASSGAGSTDRVQLTDSARALQEAARTNSGATMDTKKVEQIRQSLANGTYKVDAGRIADRMMSLENQINGKS
ncbi:anti-sigma-28 factor, FlgM family [Dyella jiangningensis]|uniref:flagellar biosynthesis anti-sigma factor FlgM n=1 Tax=Dyella sp. AtDHG13 TaxID=1938897 RepID=UPI000890089E|nr:flagellar biosynthesis anti-sigma factor FlgM [Dyella sp. AtDHG13]PXV52628.1 FlgM family anti-sigma-28 factor [Dyella sp. AtDHG13]SDL52827.1 anti-sigma-28 factor, FlgM family [Dyella jiangningensis]